ncbi:hypothetical protein [Kordia sp.]|uniref:hypothetical protein n=1 Tax=Kordia sp. TaxID=1965332 RepID=UPI003D6C2E38
MKSVLIIITSLFFLSSYAQEENGFKLRKSAIDYLADNNSGETNRGALFSFTKPKGESASVLLNAAAIYTFNFMEPKVDRERKLIFYAQYDVNTLINEEQNNLIGGFIYKDNLLKGQNKDRELIKPELAFSGGLRRDFENKFDALQTKITFSLIEFDYKKKANNYQPSFYRDKEKDSSNTSTNKSGWNFIGKNFFYLINLGLEYDYRFSGVISELDGNLLRSFSQLKFSWKVFDPVVIYSDLQYRQNLWNTTGIDTSSFTFLTTGVDLPFSLNDNISSSVGLVYVNGENPNNGFNKQSYYAVNLSLKIN